ncbi:MAG: cupin domain-containing protein [Lachnospiraceae bacterium]|nr:cupin domain-containing protein [Lachnospiraceae bacterium]
MIRKKDECAREYREKMRDGNGTVELVNFISGPADLSGKGRLFSKIILKSGCSIGYHVHEGDSELFYILKGRAEYNDNGTKVTVEAGDVTICPAGSGHGIENNTDETVELIAVIVYAE